MGAKKLDVNFNAYWNFLKGLARDKGLGKGEWMAASGISYRRYSEFDSGKRDVTTFYFIHLCGGLDVDLTLLPKITGKPYTKAQQAEIDFFKQVKAQLPFLRVLLADPKMLSASKRLVGYTDRTRK